MKVAINGFGRIGRPSLKIILEKPNLDIVAINDLGDIESLAYLLKYDTAYGVYQKDVQFKIIENEAYNLLVVEDKEIKVYSNSSPDELPWGDLNVDVVLECTGFFTNREGASKHLKAGARKVIISAPTKEDGIKMVVLGVNEGDITAEDEIIANASCTTNCIAPMMKVLDENFGVEKSLMSTIHSYTSTQNIVDGSHKKDPRRGRAAAQNIVPTTTGAAVATTRVLTQLDNKFDGMAYRVPTLVGSISDVVVLLGKDVTIEDVNNVFVHAADNEMRGIIQATNEALVTHDIVGNPHSVIFQTDLTQVTGGNLVKVVGWYDNEWGYSNRLVELAEYLYR